MGYETSFHEAACNYKQLVTIEHQLIKLTQTSNSSQFRGEVTVLQSR